MTNEIRFNGRVVLITGGGAGMGREHARLIAKRGAKIVVNDNVAEAAHAVAAEINAEGGEAFAHVADISSWDGAQSAVSAALDNFGRLDSLVSNAAIINMRAMAEMTPEIFEHLFRVNAHGAYYITMAAWPHLLNQKYGRIVLVSSDAALAGQAEITHYAASKGAVMGMVRSLAHEGATHNVLVNGLFPGAYTQMVKQAAITPETAAAMERALPAHLVSPAVAWLVHESNVMTGEMWQASAGRVARLFVGSTRGYWNPSLQVEDVRDHIADIMTEDGYAVCTDTADVVRWMLENTGVTL